ATVTGQVSFVIDRGEQVHTLEAAKALIAAQPEVISVVSDEEEDEPEHDHEEMDAEDEEPMQAEGESTGGESRPQAAQEGRDNGARRKRRRRRRRGGGAEGQREQHGDAAMSAQPSPADDQEEAASDAGAEGASMLAGESAGVYTDGEGDRPHGEGEPRGRRGGRRNRRDREGGPEVAPGNGERAFGEQNSGEHGPGDQPLLPSADIA